MFLYQIWLTRKLWITVKHLYGSQTAGKQQSSGFLQFIIATRIPTAIDRLTIIDTVKVSYIIFNFKKTIRIKLEAFEIKLEAFQKRTRLEKIKTHTRSKWMSFI